MKQEIQYLKQQLNQQRITYTPTSQSSSKQSDQVKLMRSAKVRSMIVKRYERNIQKQFNKLNLNYKKVQNIDKLQQKIDQIYQQLIVQYCQESDIEYNEYLQPDYQNEDRYTFAMWLSDKGIIPPQKWIHNHLLKNKYGETVAMILAQKGIIPPKEWEHNPSMQSADRMTVAMYLAQQRILPPTQWLHDTTIIDKYGRTVALTLANKGIIPSQEWYHDPNIKANNQYTVAMYLAHEKVVPPAQWYHDPSFTTRDGWTTAMLIVNYCKVIPDEHWNHDPNMQNNEGWTVAMFLANYSINPPQCWYHNSSLQNERKVTTPMLIAQYCKQQPTKEWVHDPTIQNNNGWTVAMLVAYYCKQIPEIYWMHDITLQNNNGNSLKDFLQDRRLPVPQQWKDQSKMSIFDQACFGIVPKIDKDMEKVAAEQQDEDGFTVAMILTIKNIKIPKQFYHNSNLTNRYRFTVAMLQAYQKQIPNKQWEHIPDKTDCYGETVACILSQNGIIPPKQWEHDPKLVDGLKQTVAICLAQNGIIPPCQWDHNKFMRGKSLDGKKNYTVQNYLQKKNVEVPSWWKYDNVINENDDTQAIQFAKEGKIPPANCKHDPLQNNKDMDTVAILLSDKGIVPPKQWMYDINIKNAKGQSIKTNLLQFGYDFIKGKVYKYETYTENNTCQICFNDGQQQFIKAKCIHKICLDCFKDMVVHNQYDACPIDRQKDWYILNEVQQ